MWASCEVAITSMLLRWQHYSYNGARGCRHARVQVHGWPATTTRGEPRAPPHVDFSKYTARTRVLGVNISAACNPLRIKHCLARLGIA